jgi:KaiC/GvpD/RAD55 family RecA-like ATPase
VIIFTVDLRANTNSSGTVSTWLSELKKTGAQTPVTGANISDSVILSNRTQTYALGIGSINYTFQSGSFIQLNVRVATSSAAIPYLVWDEAANQSRIPPLLPTNVRIPTVDSTRLNISLQTNQPRYGTIGSIIEANTDCGCVRTNILANVTDSLGVYRLSGSLILTAPNGTSTQIIGIRSSDYLLAYSYNATFQTGPWRISLRLLDSSGNSYSLDYEIWAATFYEARIKVTDQAGNPLQNATGIVTDTLSQGAKWNATTNSTGFAMLRLPSSDTVGSLNLTLSWHGGSKSQQIQVVSDTSLVVPLDVYVYGVKLLMGGVIPLPNANVTILHTEKAVGNATTGLDGGATFQLFAGNYTAQFEYLRTQSNCNVLVNGNGVTVCAVPFPTWLSFSAAAGVAICIALSVTVVIRRRTKLHPRDFSYLNELMEGGLPTTCFVVITGNSGSGKSVLLESLAIKHLIEGQSCIYITNTEHPSETREHMISLGLPTELANPRKLLFVDSYSAISRTQSTEEFQVSSHTDLTSLGIEITKCLEKLGTGADIYIDSLTPMLASLKVDSILRFLQSTDGRAKTIGGKLCVTVGTGIDKADMAKIEEISDCVIDTDVQESKERQRRRLRVKKLRGKAYSDKWITFLIESGKGIVFLTRTKTDRKNVSIK